MPDHSPQDNLVLEIRDIRMSYELGKQTIPVLQGASLTLKRGSISSLVAPSGAGKSTLMHIAGLLCHPDKGSLRLLGQRCHKLSDNKLARLRAKHIGFVYQQHMLMSEMTCLENVMVPMMILGKHSKAEYVKRATILLEELGLSQRLMNRPAELSGGERQRCAIARALINEPDCILADEPTGNLDPATADKVWNVFMTTLRRKNSAALIVTHNPSLAKMTDQIYELNEGRIFLHDPTD